MERNNRERQTDGAINLLITPFGQKTTATNYLSARAPSLIHRHAGSSGTTSSEAAVSCATVAMVSSTVGGASASRAQPVGEWRNRSVCAAVKRPVSGCHVTRSPRCRGARRGHVEGVRLHAPPCRSRGSGWMTSADGLRCGNDSRCCRSAEMDVPGEQYIGAAPASVRIAISGVTSRASSSPLRGRLKGDG